MSDIDEIQPTTDEMVKFVGDTLDEMFTEIKTLRAKLDRLGSEEFETAIHAILADDLEAHYHRRLEDTDACADCGLDLRDDIHCRVGEMPKEKTPALRLKAVLATIQKEIGHD